VQQQTIARAVEWRGVGLHSGKPAAVTVAPAAADTGLVFVVPGSGGGPEATIPARPEAVHSTARATTLAAPSASGSDGAGAASPADGPRIATVEHLLASLFALGIHDARIEVTGGEIPVLDGSAWPFVSRLRRAGVRALAAQRRELEVASALRVGDDERWIRIEPAEGLRIDYAIDFPHPAIGRQTWSVGALDADVFERELAPARTFGFADEVERLRRLGLAHGGDLSNTLVIGDHAVLNPGGLRWPDELVRHKVVDLLGDLALLAGELHAHITVEKGGHGLHHALVRALVEAPGLLVERWAAAGAAGASSAAGASGAAVASDRARAAAQPG